MRKRLRDTGAPGGGRLRSALLLGTLAAALAATPAARAGVVLDRAASALENDPVYVDPAAEEHLTANEKARVEREIATSRSGPVYIVVLPERAATEAGGDPTEAVRLIASEVHRRGTYAGVIGNHFRALSDVLRRGEAGTLATQALDTHGKDGVTATLVDFVDRVAAARNGGGGAGGRHISPWFLLILAGGGLLFFRRWRTRQNARRVELAAVRDAAKEDLVTLAEDVQRLEHRVEGNADAQGAYDRALASYEEGSQAFDRAHSPEELAQVAKASSSGE